MIDQLHYTWAVRGLQGRGRFQVAAASPGLRDLTSDRARLAMRLCRWVARRDEIPVSYGWIDARGSRLVFRRIPTGTTPDGRPGNFAVHVLASATGELTIDSLLAAAAEDLWWDGRVDAGPDLPLLHVQPLCPPHPAADVDEVTAVLAQFLGSGWAGPVSGAWNAVLDAAIATHRTLPGVLNNLASFSTFEDGESVAWFQAAGTRINPLTAPRTTRSAVAAAELFTSHAPGAAAILQAAAATSSGQGKTDWGDLVALSVAVNAAHTDGVADLSSLRLALARPTTAGNLLENATIRAAVAAAVAAGTQQLVDALAIGATGMPAELLGVFGGDIVRWAMTRPDPDRDLAAASVHIAQLPGAVLAGLARQAVNMMGTSGARLWPMPLLREALTLPRLPGEATGQLIAVAAASPGVESLVADSAVPAHRRADLAAAAQDRIPAATLGRLAASDRAIAATCLPLLPPGRLVEVLASLPARAAAVTLSMVRPRLEQATAVAAVRALVPELEPQSAGDLLRGLAGVSDPELRQQIANLADATWHRQLHFLLTDTSSRLDARTVAAVVPSSPLGRKWLDFLDSAAGITRDEFGPSTARVVNEVQWLPSNDRRFALNLACQIAVGRVPMSGDPAQALAWVHWLCGVFDPGDDPRALYAPACSAAARDRVLYRRNAMVVVVVVAVVLSDGVDQETVRLVRHLTFGLDSHGWLQAADLVERTAPDRARRLASVRDGKVEVLARKSRRSLPLPWS